MAINLLATYFAYRITMDFFNADQAKLQEFLENAAAETASNDADF
jgi:hypothetical protein